MQSESKEEAWGPSQYTILERQSEEEESKVRKGKVRKEKQSEKRKAK